MPHSMVKAHFLLVLFVQIEDTKEEVPVKILGDAVTNLVEHILSNFHHERFIISACHILKVSNIILRRLFNSHENYVCIILCVCMWV